MKSGWILAVALCLCAARSAEAEEVDFATLSGFDYVEGMDLPSEVTDLDGEVIRVPGFMAPEVDGEDDVEFFMLIDDACGCEGTPKLNEIIFCAMPEGETTEILSGTVFVEGTIYVGEQVEDGVVVSVYELDVDLIEK